MRSYFVLWLFVLGFLYGCSYASAPDIPAPDALPLMATLKEAAAPKLSSPLTLAQAQLVGLTVHPRIQGVRQDIVAAYGRQIQEALWNNPNVTLEAEDIASDKGGVSAAQVTISLSQEIPVNGALSLGAQVAAKEQEELSCDYEQEVLTVASDIYLAFQNNLLAEKREQEMSVLLETATSALTQAKQLTDAGKILFTEWLKAEKTAMTATIKHRQAQSSKRIARQNLAALLAISTEQLPECQDGSPLPSVLMPFPQLLEKLQHNPQIRKMGITQSRLQVQKSQLRAQNWPNPEVSIGGRRNYEDLQNTLVFGLGISLPVWNRQQGKLLELEALSAKAAQEEKSLRTQLHRELFNAYEQYQAARHNIDKHVNHILPSLQTTLSLAIRGYEQGKLSGLEILLTRQAQAEAQLEFLQENENLYTALAAIYKLVGFVRLDR